MRYYIIEKPDGTWDLTVSTAWKELWNKCPRVNKGTIILGPDTYLVDPRTFRRMSTRRWRYLKLIAEDIQIALYVEGHPHPVPYLGSDRLAENIRMGEVLTKWSKGQRLRKLFVDESSYLWVVLIMSLLVNVALAVVMGASTFLKK